MFREVLLTVTLVNTDSLALREITGFCPVSLSHFHNRYIALSVSNDTLFSMY